MKKPLFVLLLFISMGAVAQNLRFNPYAIYAFDDKVDSYYSNTSYFEGKIKGGLLWGGGLEYMVHPQYGIELSYLHMSTTAPMTYYSNQPPAGVKNGTFDIDINYLMLGGMRYAPMNPNVEAFGGLQLGAAFINADRPSGTVAGEASASATKFAWGIRGGCNIFPGGDSSRFGIKLQAGLLSAVQGVGGSLYFGTGGAGAGVSSYSTFLQFCLGGGLVFKFGK